MRRVIVTQWGESVLFPALYVCIRGHTLLWVYRQSIAMPYIALARQAWIYRNIYR